MDKSGVRTRFEPSDRSPMAQRKLLVGVGNSLGVVIEKPVLELLGIEREVEVTIENGALVITPVGARRPARREDKLEAIARLLKA